MDPFVYILPDGDEWDWESVLEQGRIERWWHLPGIGGYFPNMKALGGAVFYAEPDLPEDDEEDPGS